MVAVTVTVAATVAVTIAVAVAAATAAAATAVPVAATAPISFLATSVAAAATCASPAAQRRGQPWHAAWWRRRRRGAVKEKPPCLEAQLPALEGTDPRQLRRRVGNHRRGAHLRCLENVGGRRGVGRGGRSGGGAATRVGAFGRRRSDCSVADSDRGVGGGNIVTPPLPLGGCCPLCLRPACQPLAARRRAALTPHGRSAAVPPVGLVVERDLLALGNRVQRKHPNAREPPYCPLTGHRVGLAAVVDKPRDGTRTSRVEEQVGCEGHKIKAALAEVARLAALTLGAVHHLARVLGNKATGGDGCRGLEAPTLIA